MKPKKLIFPLKMLKKLMSKETLLIGGIIFFICTFIRLVVENL